MMICHDHGHSELSSSNNRIPGRNPVVTGNDSIHTIITGLFHHITAQPVTVSLPVRYAPAYICPEPFQSQHQNRCGHDAIHIIIPDHPDPLVHLYLFLYDIQSRIHIINVMSRMKLIHGRIQIFIHGIPVIQLSFYQYFRKYFRNPVSLRNFLQICGISFDHPLFHLSNVPLFVIMNLSQLIITVKTTSASQQKRNRIKIFFILSG